MKNFKWIVVAAVYIALAKTNSLQAQENFRGIATYLVQSKFEMQQEVDKTKEYAEQTQRNVQIREAMSKGTQQNYKMEFTATESSYDEVQELAKPLAPGGFSIVVKTHNGSTTKIYKDLKEQRSFKVGEILGKQFLIIDAMQIYDWKLTDDSKKIGAYTSYKATFTPELTQEEKEIIEEKKANPGSGGLFELISDDNPTITVWYTPEIPISNGPGIYHGLPGLILEVNERDTILLCTKIEINPEEKLKLKKPKSGKEISQKDFDVIWDEKLGKNSPSRNNQEIFINKN
jgi:GLPGLI family protein